MPDRLPEHFRAGGLYDVEALIKMKSQNAETSTLTTQGKGFLRSELNVLLFFAFYQDGVPRFAGCAVYVLIGRFVG
jgi:hypothetical protein